MAALHVKTASSPPVSWPELNSAVAEAPAEVTTGVAVRDLTTGAEFGHHHQLVFPAASTIKLLILIAVARAADNGQINLEKTAPVLPSQKVSGSGVLNWLETGLELSLQDHARLMIAISDNTASNVLIDAVGVPAIHELQRSLGLESTSLNRRFLGRLPSHGKPENVACAADLVAILGSIADGSAASAERSAWMLRLLGEQQHTDRLARNVPASLTFAGKSGSLTGLAHDAGLLRGPGGAATVAVLTQGFDDPYVADAFIGSIGSAVVSDLGLEHARTLS